MDLKVRKFYICDFFYIINLLLGYSCALVGDILLQGHLYVTENYVAFHSNVFGYVTRVSHVTTEATFLEPQNVTLTVYSKMRSV